MDNGDNNLANTGIFNHTDLGGLSLVNVGKTACSADWHWDTSPGLPDYDLLFIHSGRGWYHGPGSADEARLEVSGGSCLLLRPGECWRGRQPDPQDLMTVTHVHFTPASSLDLSALPAHHFRVEQPPFIASLLERMVTAWREHQPAVAAAWLGCTLLELRRQLSRPQWTGAALERAQKIQNLCLRLRERPADDWTAARMARLAGCSSDHLFRLFRRYAGTTPWAFLLACRMEQAVVLLRTTSYPVARVAEEVGYPDIFTFSRQFKRSQGHSPAACRKGASCAPA